MGGKPRIIPESTYVLDEKDLEEYEELTIETVMQEALDAEDESTEASAGGSADAPAENGDTDVDSPTPED